MNKNYYQILEVDTNASFEVIEKAYKTLAKKYHPDLQENSLKNDSEEKLKLINEAYEVLSNEEKRKNYDLILKQEQISSETLDNLYQENENLHFEIEKLKNLQNNSNSTLNPNSQKTRFEENSDYINQIEQARKQAYYDAYIQDLKNRGYKIKYKKTLKDYFKNFIALLITFFILFLLFQLPFVKNFLASIYQENLIIRNLINSIINIFN